MTTPDDRRPGRTPRQPSQATDDRQARSRRAPLFPLADDDIEPSARRRPPSPLGDLVADIDHALPTKAAPPRPAARPPAESREAARQPAPPSAPREAAERRREAQPAPRPAAVRDRPAAPRKELRVAPIDELVEAQSAPLRQARVRFDDTAGDLARLEHDLASRGRLGHGGYLAPAPPASSVSQWVWLGVIALASVLVLTTMGGGGGGAAFSRWGSFLSGGGAELESRAALFAGQARPVGDYALKAPPSITPAVIDRILASYGSPAAGTGEVWYNLGLKYGIDPAFAVAFFIHESAAGTAQAWAGLKPDGSTTHNVGNIICAGYASCYGRFRDYPSWSEGIEDWYRLIDVEYLQGRGHQTVADIIPVYAPSVENDVQGYINVVQGMVDEWRSQGAP